MSMIIVKEVTEDVVSILKPRMESIKFNKFRTVRDSVGAVDDGINTRCPKDKWPEFKKGLQALGFHVTEPKSPENRAQDKYSVFDDSPVTPESEGLTSYWRDQAEGFIAAAEDRAKIFSRMGEFGKAKASIELGETIRQRVIKGQHPFPRTQIQKDSA